MRKAFTLLEILVALGIAALICAVLYPVLARVQAKTRAVQCKSNLKQIGLALHQYAADYDDRLPGIDTKIGTSVVQAWPDLIYPYVHGPVFNCPGDLGPNLKPYGFSADRRKPSGGTGSYGCNAIGPVCMNYADGSGLSLAALGNASGTVHVVDNYTTRYTVSAVALFATRSGLVGGYMYLRASAVNTGTVARHLEQANVLFCDGHVKGMRLEEVALRRGGKAVLWTVEND